MKRKLKKQRSVDITPGQKSYIRVMSYFIDVERNRAVEEFKAIQYPLIDEQRLEAFHKGVVQGEGNKQLQYRREKEMSFAIGFMVCSIIILVLFIILTIIQNV